MVVALVVGHSVDANDFANTVKECSCYYHKWWCIEATS